MVVVFFNAGQSLKNERQLRAPVLKGSQTVDYQYPVSKTHMCLEPKVLIRMQSPLVLALSPTA